MMVAPAGGPGALGLPEAAVLGAVEGVTEFLPVSSTAHLLVAERLLGVARGAQERAVLDSYLVVVQGGAILAVAWLYRRRLAAMALRPGPGGRRILGVVMVASAPAGAAGLLVGDLVKRHLFDPAPIALAWLVGGVAILVVAKRVAGRPGCPLESIGWGAAGMVGLAQCLALWPGTSRSLVTILAGVLVGLSLAAAVELSFLVGFVTLLGASGWESLRNGSEVIATLGWAGPLVGAAVAFVTAVAAIRGMVGLLSRRDLRPFGYYRIGAAATTAGLIAAGIL
jgi:undecaprenyl-diphosphatase